MNVKCSPDSYYGEEPTDSEELGGKIEKAIFSILKKLWDSILLGFGFGIGFLLIHLIGKYVNVL